VYIGQDLQVAYPNYTNIDDISGSFNGVTTSFALTVGGVAPVPNPARSNQCIISVGGVLQRPDDTGSEGFCLSGGNIIFSSAPSTGEDFFGVILAGADYVNVGANFPSGTALVPSITFDTDLDTGIYNSAANEISFSTAGAQRLSINSAGQLSNNLGSAAAPSYTFSGDVNTGIYSPGADQVAISTNGTGRVFVDASGNVGIGTSSTTTQRFIVNGDSANPLATFIESTSGSTSRLRVYVDDANGVTFNSTNTGLGFKPIIFTQGASTERARIDSSGRLLVGTDTSRTIGTGNFQIQSEGLGAEAGISTTRNANSNAGPNIRLVKTRGTSVGSTTVVQSGDGLGTVGWWGADGTNAINAANIAAEVDGTPGANNMPGRITLSTTASGASTPTEQWRISNGGTVLYNQPAPAAVDTTATLTVANLAAKIITSSTAAAVIMTLPTGTLMDGGFSGLYTNMCFEWSVINTGGTNAVTVAAGTGHTLVGSGTVAANNSVRFASRRTGANTWVTYRVG
jgi:hypothetical protein